MLCVGSEIQPPLFPESDGMFRTRTGQPTWNARKSLHVAGLDRAWMGLRRLRTGGFPARAQLRPIAVAGSATELAEPDHNG